MRIARFALSLLLFPGLAAAQDQGVALNMGRGLDSGMSVDWTFRENWTLRPTLGIGYSDLNGFEAFGGGTVLRSFAIGERVYAYGGAGVHFGPGVSTGGFTKGRQTPGGVRGTGQIESSSTQSSGSLLYFTAPVGLRARLFGNLEAFAETAYQKAMSGQFALRTGQFSGNGRQRFGGTVGISLRLQ